MVDWWTGGGSKVNARPFGSISRPQDESEKEAKSGDDAATTCCRLLNEWKLFFYRLFLAWLNCVIAPEWPKSCKKKLSNLTNAGHKRDSGRGWVLPRQSGCTWNFNMCQKAKKRKE